MASVNPKGHSQSWLAQKKNVVGIFNEWKGVEFKWEEVTEKQATDPSLYEALRRTSCTSTRSPAAVASVSFSRALKT